MHMNIRIESILISIVVITGLMAVGSNAFAANCDKNPTHPQCSGGGGGEPPPTPAGNDCFDAEGAFPAIAYTTSVTTGKRRKEKTITSLHLADSTGTCSIEVWSSDGTNLDFVSFSFAKVNGSLARIVFPDRRSSEVGMFEFQMDQKRITTPLPLQATTVHSVAAPGLSHIEISNDGSAIVFATEEAGSGEIVWLDKLWKLDLSACQENCPADLILEANNEGFDWVSISDDNQRIFYSSHKRIDDTYQVSMVRSLNDGWSDPVDVVSSAIDLGYSQAKFQTTSLTRWNQDEVLSINVELTQNRDYVLDLINVEDITTFEPEPGVSCFSASVCTQIGTNFLNEPFYQAKFIGDELTPSRMLIGTWPAVDLGRALELDASVPVTTGLPLGLPDDDIDILWVTPAR